MMRFSNHTVRAKIPTKNTSLALVLALFLGPLGMLYTTKTGGFIFLILSMTALLLNLGTGLIVLWILQLLWTGISVYRYNKRAFEKILYNRKAELKRRATSL